MKKVSIKKNIALSTAYQILTMIIPFITTPYISRVIGSAGVGIYSYTHSIQMYFSMFAALGTVTYGAREIARNRDDKEKLSKLFWEIELLTVATSVICLIIWFIFIGITNEYKIYYIVLTLYLFNTMLDISWLYTGLEQLKYTVTKNAIFRIIGVVLLFVFVKNSGDLLKYVTLTALTTLLGTASMWIYLPKFVKKVKFKELKIWHHFKETLIYFVPSIATSVYSVLDKTLIGLITKNEDENGFYEQATKIINLTKSLTFTSLNTVLGARISYLFAENKIEEIHKRIDNSINYILFMGFGIMFGLWGVSKNFVPLFFGAGYDKVVSLIYLLSPLVIIVGISNCLGSQYYTPSGLRKQSAKYIIAGSIVNLIFNIILIPKFWSIGASAATIIAEGVIAYLYLRNCNNFMTFKKIIKLGWKKLLSGIIMFAVVIGLSYININKIILIVFQVGFGALTYLVMLILLKDKFVYSILDKYILSRLKGAKNGGV